MAKKGNSRSKPRGKSKVRRAKNRHPFTPKASGSKKPRSQTRKPGRNESIDRKALARLAENVWRLDRRAKRIEDGSDWAQPVIERLTDDLRELGVEIIDRTGTVYSDGETMEKLHSDAPANWSGALVVTEVISPIIRIGGVVIEHGKVVVGADQAGQP